ncbi:MAG: hypothetical protein ABIQ86_05380 [Steroidobacteraceae bacterium]
MGDSPQRRALRNYRSRLANQGMTRFEVLGRVSDRELIRRLARRLADQSHDAERLRADVQRGLGDEAPKNGRILAALLRSPLVGAELDLARVKAHERKVRL